MAKAIGIDLGTTNSVAAHATAGVRVLQNRENEDLTPSAVCWYKGDTIVGHKALDRMGAAPRDTIISVKRLMGRAYSDPEVQRAKGRYQYRVVAPTDGTEEDVRVVLGGKEHSPIEISALILKKLKEDAQLRLNEPVELAVITVPAYFTEKQKWATRKAGQLAGLKVQHILDEPTAAAIAFGVDNIGPEEVRTVLVFDLGGGTFDVSLLHLSGGLFAQVNIEGDMWLGGDDFDHRIMDYALKQIKARYGIDPSGDARFMVELKKRAQKAKEELSSLTRTDIDLMGLKDAQGNELAEELELTREQFEKMIADDVRSALQTVETALERVHYRPADIHHVILVGGSSTIPMIRRALVDKFGEQKILMNVDPMKCVAYGAAILASRLGEVWECPGGHKNALDQDRCSVCGAEASERREAGQILYGVTPQAFGIQAVGDRFEEIIAKNAPYPTPTPVVREFRTPQANLRRIRVPVYQGGNPTASKNELQLTVWLELPKNLPADTPVDVGFRLDKDGILDQVTVTLKDGSGRQVQVYPDRGDQRRSQLEKKMEELRKQWAEKRFMLDADVGPKVEELYNEAAEAANRNDADGFEQKLKQMERQLNPKPEWALKAEALLSNSDIVVEQFDWLVDDPQRLARIKTLNDEIRRAVEDDQQAAAERKMEELLKELNELPGVVIFLLRMGQAAYRAQQHGDMVTADRINAGIRAMLDACRGGDVETVKRIVRELGPVIDKVLGSKLEGAIAEGLLK
jgi:molecular chaperone DnaK (HSP70)